MAQFFSNAQGPKQTALNNVSGKNGFDLPKSQKYNKLFPIPIKNFSGNFGTNQNYPGSGGFNYATPQSQPTPQPAPQTTPRPTPSSNTSTFPGMNFGQSQTPQPTKGTSPYYAQQIENIRDKYAPRVAAPYAQFGIGEGQKRLSDYELARGNFNLEATKPLLTASLPQAVSPGSSLIQPLAGTSGTKFPGYSAEDSAFNSGIINQITNQGAQSVSLNQAQNTISSISSLLGNDNQSSINRLNNFINQIQQNVSSPELATFRTNLGALAQQVAPYNPTLSQQLTNYAGDGLGNANSQAIMSAINAAQQAIQSQQQALYGGYNQSSGSTGGSFAEAW